MILDGPSIVSKGLIILGDPDLVNTEDQIQPNGIDLRLNKVYWLQGVTNVPTDGKAKFDGQASEILPKDGIFQLKPQNGIYLVDFLESICVKDGWCANLVTRSSLVRSGIDVVSGLWDTGFEGQLGASLRLINPVNLQWGCKMCQVIFHKSEFNGLRYSGRYQNANSQTALTT